MLRHARLISFFSAMFAAALPASAQYPDKPITLVAPSGPGTFNDMGIRTFVPYLEACLGSGATVVVRNMPGASGDISNTYLATAAPDGYTLGAVSVPGVVSQPITAEKKYSIGSFEYLGGLAGSYFTIAVSVDSSWKTMNDLIKDVLASGKPLQISEANLGTSGHFALLQLEGVVPGLKFQVIPLSDGAAALAAVAGGHLPATASGGAEMMPDKLRILGISSRERLKRLPDVPTFVEQGIDLVTNANMLYAFPKGTPGDIASKVAGCITATSNNADYLAEADKRGMNTIYLSADVATKFVQSEDEKLRKIWAESPWIKP